VSSEENHEAKANVDDPHEVGLLDLVVKIHILVSFICIAYSKFSVFI